MNDRPRLAVAGTGYFSQFHFESWARLPVEIVGICSLDEISLQQVAADNQVSATFADFETMLDETKPEFVDIITPPPTHVPFASASIARDIPVICQKPFTCDLREARALAELATTADVPLIVHENFRFQPWYRKLHELLSAGSVGDLYAIRFDLRPGDGQGPDAYLARQPYFQKLERFLIRETAVHLIDVFRFLDGEVNAVFADLRTINPAIAGEDAGIVIFEMTNETRCIFDGNRLADHVAKNHRLTMGEMTIEGNAATLTLNGDGQIHRRAHGSNVAELIDYEWNDQGYAGDCVHKFQTHALASITENKPAENTADEYLRNLVIEDAIYNSNELGKRITLD